VAVYELRVERPGFTTLSHNNVGGNVAQATRIDFKLQIATVAQEVNVTGALPFIDATNSSVGQVVDPRRMQELPINGRQFANLAATLPGVGLAFHSDPTKGMNYAPLINGGAGRNINYQIDGGDNNDDTVGGLLQQFPLEAIEEFHFETQRYKAEYGRSNGGVMNVVTKSGTNQFQGSVFELFRDKAMNALTENEMLAGVKGGTPPTKGDYRRDQFGGSLGGPLMMDRVHFFFALERTQQNTTQTVNTQGLFPLQDGVYPTLYRDNLGTVKLSAHVNAAQDVSIRYGRNNNSFPFNASPTTTPDNWGDAKNSFNSVNVNHNWVLGGAKLNEIVFQYSNFNDLITERTQAPNQMFLNGVMTGSSLATPQSTEQVKYQIRDDFSWLVAGHGGVAHTFKAGITFVNEPRLFIDGSSGKGITAYVMQNTLLAPVLSVMQIGGEASVNIPTKQAGLYIQDWRISERLTVNAGVRYDLVTGLNFDQSKNPNFREGSGRGEGWRARRDRGPRELRPRSALRPEQHSASHRRRLRRHRYRQGHRPRRMGHLQRLRIYELERAAGRARRQRQPVRRRVQRFQFDRPGERRRDPVLASRWTNGQHEPEHGRAARSRCSDSGSIPDSSSPTNFRPMSAGRIRSRPTP
jgi:hypothetical protein